MTSDGFVASTADGNNLLEQRRVAAIKKLEDDVSHVLIQYQVDQHEIRAAASLQLRLLPQHHLEDAQHHHQHVANKKREKKINRIKNPLEFDSGSIRIHSTRKSAEAVRNSFDTSIQIHFKSMDDSVERFTSRWTLKCGKRNNNIKSSPRLWNSFDISKTSSNEDSFQIDGRLGWTFHLALNIELR